MRHRYPHCLIAQRSRGWGSSAAVLTVLLALGVERCLAASVHPHPDCTGPCGADLLCPSADCKAEWDSCPPGTIQVGTATLATDEGGKCHDTECALGGCEEGFKEVSRKPCFSLGHCSIGACFQEHCCLLRPSVRCCVPLRCNVTFADCEVPQQTYLSDTSRSAVEVTKLPHGHRARFPFYTAAQLPPGGSCQDALLNGGCLCDDGVTEPGCQADNSSSWYVWVDGPQANASAAAAVALLPPNLSLTCAVAPPPPLPPPAAPLPPTAADATATAQGLSSPPPPAGGDGKGSGGRPRSPQSPTRSGSHGWLVAVIVISCLALAGVTAGIVLWCCGLLPDWHNLRIRSLTSYEPIFTGQSYTPGMGGGGGRHAPSRSSAGGGGGGGAPYLAEDIPWNRFCAAVTEAARRVMYGRRYVEESASAAAAAERYRTLNSLGRRRSDAASGGAASAFEDRGPTAWATGGKSTRGSLVMSTYSSGGRHKPHDDDLGMDEVFTLEDLGVASSDTAGGGVRSGGAWRHAGPLPTSRLASAAAGGGGGGGAQLPQSLHASSGASAISPSGPWWQQSARSGGAAAAAELDGGGGAATPTADGQQQQHRPRLNQFGVGGGADGGGGSAAAAGHMGGDVIHTRPLALGDGDGDGDSGGEYGDGDEAPPPDVDAPLRWLPSPQVTGEGPGPRG